MAPGTLGADELPLEEKNHKWNENIKVYTRRIFRKPLIKTTSTPSSNDQSNGKKNGDKKVVIAVKRNDGGIQVANAVIANSSVETIQENDVTEVVIVDVPGNGNIIQEGYSNSKCAEKFHDNLNSVEKLCANVISNNDEGCFGVNIVEKGTENGNTFENVHDSGNSAEEVPDNGIYVDEVPNNDDDVEELCHQGKDDNVEGLPDQGPNSKEMHDRENNVEEMQDRCHNVEKLSQKSPSPRLLVEESNFSQPLQDSLRIETVVLSEDSSSLNQGEGHLLNGHDQDDNLANEVARKVRPLVTQLDGRLNINVTATESKEEVKILKRKLEDDLNRVRKMARRLEAKESQLNSVDFDRGRYEEFPAAGRFQFPVLSGLENGSSSMQGNLKSYATSFSEPRPFRRSLSISVVNNNHHGVGETAVAREKRTPKANQYYRNSEFLLGKEKLPPECNRKSKSIGGVRKRVGGECDYGFGVDKKIFKKCNDLLQKLRNHMHGWVFNQPVDVKKLGLHDYFDIIKHPMDLGTVETRLKNNWYRTPREFADDVRLTFHNAMTYNPPGQDVHIMAKELLWIFEESWPAIETDFDRKLRYDMMCDLGTPTPTSRKTYPSAHVPIYMPLPPPPRLQAPPTFQETRNLERSQSMPVRAAARPKPTYSVLRTPVPKKPKARDPNKRDMTFEEKQKLSTNLQSLPSEKLDAIVQIIKRRNTALSQHDDEIEVDIDNVDTETLWELDRFVTNYKKSLSKYKRKAEIAMQARAAAAQAPQETITPAPVITEVPREGTADAGNVTASPHTQPERHSANVSDSSSSISSSSDSGSSSSDSDSDSSSDSE